MSPENSCFLGESDFSGRGRRPSPEMYSDESQKIFPDEPGLGLSRTCHEKSRKASPENPNLDFLLFFFFFWKSRFFIMENIFLNSFSDAYGIKFRSYSLPTQAKCTNVVCKFLSWFRGVEPERSLEEQEELEDLVPERIILKFVLWLERQAYRGSTISSMVSHVVKYYELCIYVCFCFF